MTHEEAALRLVEEMKAVGPTLFNNGFGIRRDGIDLWYSPICKLWFVRKRSVAAVETCSCPTLGVAWRDFDRLKADELALPVPPLTEEGA